MLGIGNGSSRLRIGNVGVQTKFVAWNRKWRSSSQVRSLELEMEEFEPSSKLGIGNGGVRLLFRCWESGMKEFEESSRLESEMKEFESNSDAWYLEWKFEA